MDIQSLKNKFDIIGNDPSLNLAIETAVRLAPTDLSVLITGETGAGKENIARIIHQNSLRKRGKFFTEGLINSELFGHVKGSFTGASETRSGYFEEANGGTLFLDEIAELPLLSQALLLRVLQNGEYRKVGSNKVETTDVRVIAATNIDLYEASISASPLQESGFLPFPREEMISTCCSESSLPISRINTGCAKSP